MSSQFLFWVRRVAAVLVFLVALTAALAGGLLTPYFLAARTANIPLLTISAVVSFALVTWFGTKLALLCWGGEKKKDPPWQSADYSLSSFLGACMS
jgi:hypothetical protein